MRIGTGYDVHQLVEGRPLILGGVEIPHDKGLLGHSDADVLLHAITDAILGAVALGDVGVHFPDTDEKWKDVDSRELLSIAYEKAVKKGYLLENLDATILAEKPKLRPYIEEMRQNIADVLVVNIDRVSVKATTEEGLGFTGKEEGIAAQAVVLMK